VVVWGITAGAGKCTEANSSGNGPPNNNSWAFNIIDSTHIDLVGSTFVGGHTGTSGTGPGGFGAIGTSLEALTFSFDSISTATLLQLAAFDSSHRLGFFSGPALEAIVETPDQDLGERFMISWLRPMTDAQSCFGSLFVRDTAQQPVSQTGGEGPVPAPTE